MPAPFPSRWELKWTGASLMLAQLLWVVTGIFSAAYDPEDIGTFHNIETEEQVVEFHNVMSSAKAKVMVEVYAGMYWISFVFLLVGIFGIKKILLSIFADTHMEMWVYVWKRHTYSAWLSQTLSDPLS